LHYLLFKLQFNGARVSIFFLSARTAWIGLASRYSAAHPRPDRPGAKRQAYRRFSAGAAFCDPLQEYCYILFVGLRYYLFISFLALGPTQCPNIVSHHNVGVSSGPNEFQLVMPLRKTAIFTSSDQVALLCDI
jgi:hypothetical protein